MDKVDVAREINTLDDYWSQRTLGEVNGNLIKVAKGLGETHWHKHDDQDEAFLVCEGTITVRLRGKTVELAEGELFIVPKGTEHAVAAENPAGFIVIGLSITSTRAGGKPEWSYS